MRELPIPTRRFSLQLTCVNQDKDNSRYDMALAQSLDGIRARAKWSERSTTELKQWLENWKKQSGGA